MEIEKIILAIAGAIVGSLITRFLSRRKEKMENTLSLMQEYHSPIMLEARVHAWNALIKNYSSNPMAFHEWFSDKKNFKDPDYEQIVTVLYFWYRVLVMKQQGLIMHKLASDLLGYQWRHWQNVFSPLYNETLKDSSDRPEWIILFLNKNMDWLAEGARLSGEK